MTCPKCKMTTNLDFNFCPTCGKNLKVNIGFEALRADLETQYENWYFRDELKSLPNREYCTSNYVRVGGYSGGSCWDWSNPQYYHDGGEPDFNNVIEVLVKHGVDGDVAHKFISRNYHDKLSYTEYEYYGNSDDYEMYVYNIDDILEFVKSL